MSARIGSRWLAAGSDPGSVVVAAEGPPAGLAEVFVRGKNDAIACEDIAVVSPHHVAVLDGMSSPLRKEGEAATGRQFAMAAATAISELPALITAREAITQITWHLADLGFSHAGPGGAVAAIYSIKRKEVWRVGDIHVTVNGQHHPGRKEVDVAMARYRAAVNSAHLAGGMSLQQLMTTDPGLQAAGSLLAVQPALANQNLPYGYGVLDGSPVPDDLIEILPVLHPCWVVLASDGFLTAAPSLETAQSELEQAVATDPACIGPLWAMGKALGSQAAAPDDRSYLRVYAR